MIKLSYTTKTGMKKNKLVSSKRSLLPAKIKIWNSGGEVVSTEEVEGFVVWFGFSDYSVRYEYGTKVEATKRISDSRRPAVHTNF